MAEYKDEQYNLEEIPEFALMPAREPEISEAAEESADSAKEEAAEPVEFAETAEPVEFTELTETETWQRQDFGTEEPAEEPAVSLQAPAPLPPAAPVRITSAKDSLLTQEIDLMDLRRKPEICFWVEEDILVPDSKPDLKTLLNVEGRVWLDEPEIYGGTEGLRFLKAGGNIRLQVLYEAANGKSCAALTAMKANVPFREDVEVNAGADTELSLVPAIQSLEYSVVNERKFRVRARICLRICEYGYQELSLLQGSSDKELQCRRETLNLTNVALRKREPFEVRESLEIREGMPEIGDILSYDVRLGAPVKQVDSEKAVINVPVYYSVLYSAAEDFADEGTQPETALLQGKTEFTQFISLDWDTARGAITDARIQCHIADISLEPALDSGGRQSLINLALDVETSVELYSQISQDNVTDLYHMNKDVLFDKEERGLTQVVGSVQGESAAREVLSLPAGGSDVGEVLYLSGRPAITETFVEPGKAVAEGNVAVRMICQSGNGEGFVTLDHKLPFRCVMNSSGAEAGMEILCDVCLKELWYDRINGQQLELNASVGVSGVLLKPQVQTLLKNVNLADLPEDEANRPSLVLYMTKDGDDLWSVAKRYRGNPALIEEVNAIPTSGNFSRGSKVLVVR